MATSKRTVILCSCEDSMALDADAVERGLGDVRLLRARHLCGPQLDTYRAAAAGGDVVVACTAMRALFEEVAEDEGLAATVAFANVRETAGWSSEGAAAGAKMAALLAVAEPGEEAPVVVTYESGGVTLIYGRDERVITAAERLKDKLDITVVIAPGANVQPPRAADYPIRQGRLRSLTGRLGAFELTLDAYAQPRPSSRGQLAFGPGRDGAASKADIVIDLSGEARLPAPDLREGYLRAAPGDAAALERVLAEAADLVGTFDKARAITLRPDLCAHARSRIVGCRRCLDLCPTGAITPAGDHVAIDAHICAGCGQCAAACPTGAAAYALPPVDRLIERLRLMLTAYAKAGGGSAQLLFHDGEHGAELIDALARHGEGLPASTLPVAVNEVTQIGLETIAAAFAYGATGVRMLTRARPRHDIAGLRATLDTAGMLLDGLGFGANAVGTIETDDPDQLLAALRTAASMPRQTAPASFMAVGGKRDVLRTALRELHRAAPRPVDVVALPAGAALGRVAVADGCTLCLACVSACPTRALSDTPDRPRLAFDEALCVQCGLCAATCPEKVITLEPRVNFKAYEAGPVALKEEEPYRCIGCGKPFGVRATIERIVRQLEGKHWMFSGDNSSRIDMIRMCEDCRVGAAVNRNVDPFAGPARPAARTSEQYLAEREARMRDKIDKGEA